MGPRIPTMLLFKGGQPIAQKVGAAPRSQIQQWLEATSTVLQPPPPEQAAVVRPLGSHRSPRVYPAGNSSCLGKLLPGFNPGDDLPKHDKFPAGYARGPEWEPSRRTTAACQAAEAEELSRFASSHCWIWLRGAAPTFCAIGWPPLNSSMVGMPRTP